MLGSSLINNNTIINCNFESNTAVKNTISLMYSNTYISKTTFSDNKATVKSKNIFVGFSNIVIEETTFTNDYDSRKTTYNTDASTNDISMGTFLFIIFDVNMIVQGCSFTNGVAYIGGAIYISGDSYITIYSSIFQDNYASSYGGAIFAVGFNNLMIG